MTAGDLAALPPGVARDVGTVVLERLVRELGGIECDDFKVAPEPLKATAVTRQYGARVSDLAELPEAKPRPAARAAGTIPAERLAASRLNAYAPGSRSRPATPHIGKESCEE